MDLKRGEFAFSNTSPLIKSREKWKMFLSNMGDDEHSRIRREHTPDQIRQRLEDGPGHSYLKDFIYGAIDGAVTTFAIVAGVAGAGLAPAVVIVLGVANLVADGFSMAISNFLGSRAEHQESERARTEEERHIELYPEGEKEEIRQIFAAKGFEGEELERVVEVITSDRERWVNTMIQDELGLSLSNPPAWKAGLATFVAFALAGAIPLIPFLLNLHPSIDLPAFPASAVMTGVAFFAVGALKSRFVQQHWLVAGGESLAVGGVAAGIAYGIGALLRDMVPSV